MEMTVSFIRDYLETLPCPICTKDVSDDDIQKMINDVNESTMRILKVKHLDFHNEDVDETWFSELEEYAIKEYKMPYYEDMSN